MSTAYLRQKLAGAATDNGDPVLTIETDSGLIRVYSPEPSEYRVSADVVEKAQNLGADMIAYGRPKTPAVRSLLVLRSLKDRTWDKAIHFQRRCERPVALKPAIFGVEKMIATQTGSESRVTEAVRPFAL